MKQSLFGSIKVKRPGRNTFNLSHEKKLSLNMGELIPILNQEVIPGDKFRVNSEILMRLSPMIAPMMHRVNVYTHFFFVPNRIIWDNWEDFITGGPEGNSAPVAPYFAMAEGNKGFWAKKTLPDYMGIPVLDQTLTYTATQNISALPFRAYAEIYNEYYRDQNLSEPIAFQKGDGVHPGADYSTLLQIRQRSWEKDYYTSCLPWAQRGGEVGIPVEFNYKNAATANPDTEGTVHIDGDGETSVNTTKIAIENLEEDGVTVNINDLRKSARLQEWLELAARGGSRYREQLATFFGVNGGDARLQRPEYLGGGRNPVVISETLQTSATNTQDTAVDASIQGTMAGHGISVGRTNSFSKSFKEHGHIIGIMSVLPRTTYQQGLNKQWSRFDKFDYYFPQFAQIGEQEVLNKELYLDLTADQNESTFGYQSRYAEYKYKESSCHGDFRDNLNYWHMGRIFDAPPNLNEDFVKSDPTQRVFAVTDPDEDKLYCQIYNAITAVRPMPYHNVPTL